MANFGAPQFNSWERQRYASNKFSVGNLILNNFCLMNRNKSECVRNSLSHNSNKFIFIHLIFLLLIISFLKIYKERNFCTSMAKKAWNCPIKSADGLIFLLKRNKNPLRYLFCYLGNLLDLFRLNALRFVLAYQNLLKILLKEFLEEKSY